LQLPINSSRCLKKQLPVAVTYWPKHTLTLSRIRHVFGMSTDDALT
jgi:hypothetical protein